MRIRNKIGLLVAIPCAVLGLMSLAHINDLGPRVFTNNTGWPLGMLASVLASLFTDPPSPTYAASARHALTLRIYQAELSAAVVVFIFAFWRRTDPARTRSTREDNMLLAMQWVVVVLAGLLDFSYFAVLGVAALFPVRVAARWLISIVTACVLVRLAHFGVLSSTGRSEVLVHHLYRMGEMVTMQLMAFGVGVLIATERRNRVQLAATNAMLLALQQLLNDTARASERLRIARDLHDAIGHHLTALILHLDLAAHKNTSDPAFTTARGLARELLSEVRSVVTVERAEQFIDLKLALEMLCSRIPEPRIVLDFDDSIVIKSPIIAQALFHSIQEAITNAVRHARSSRVDIALQLHEAGLQATITDNGVGTSSATAGNGLHGIRDRLAALGGALTIDHPAEGGLRLTITLPWRGNQ